jgi:hypothetical protein
VRRARDSLRQVAVCITAIDLTGRSADYSNCKSVFGWKSLHLLPALEKRALTGHFSPPRPLTRLLRCESVCDEYIDVCGAGGQAHSEAQRGPALLALGPTQHASNTQHDGSLTSMLGPQHPIIA